MIVETMAEVCWYGTLVQAYFDYTVSSCRKAQNYPFLLQNIKPQSLCPLQPQHTNLNLYTHTHTHTHTIYIYIRYLAFPNK